MNRKEELIELRNQLEDTPVELEYLAAKAVARAKKKRLRAFLWQTPVISFCTTALLFVLLVNLFPKAAMTMCNVPILKDLVIAVSLDPSLKLAVENDYYQVIGESQTQDDVTVNVEYMILDASHISLFFKVDAPVKAGIWHYDFTDGEKRPFPAVIFYDTMYEVGRLEEIKMDFVDGTKIPEDIVFTVTIEKDEVFQMQGEVQIADPATGESVAVTPPEEINNSKVYTFRFVLHPDSNFTQLLESYPINQTVEIMGQKIFIEKFDIYPTQSRLYLDVDENNDSLIEDLDIVLKDNKGNSYNDGGLATLTSDTYEVESISFDSSYFTKAKELTMYLNGIRLLDKDKLYGKVNYNDKTISNLPEGVTIDSMVLKDSTLNFTLSAQVDSSTPIIEIINNEYYDTDKTRYNFGSWSTDSDSTKYSSHYTITNYMDHKYLLRWHYAPFQLLEQPISLPIK